MDRHPAGRSSVRGKLLLAAPALLDPNFDRSVVLVLEHNADGALGVILNRPSDTSLEVALPRWADRAATPAVFFVGGPVSRTAVIGIGRADPPPADGFLPLFAGLGTVDLEQPPEAIGRIEEVRVFAGYSGWGPGQLEAELAERAWIIVDAEPDDIRSDDPDGLWRRVLRRQRGELAWLANFPEDPSYN